MSLELVVCKRTIGSIIKKCKKDSYLEVGWEMVDSTVEQILFIIHIIH